MRKLFPFLAGLFAISTTLAGPVTDNNSPDEAKLRQMTARFAPVDIKVDTSYLPASERLALRKMIDAAKILDAIFLRQVAPLNPTYLSALIRDDTSLGRTRLHYFSINAGPWSRLDENAPFLPNVGEKPLAGNFYPVDATREEVDTWMHSLPPVEQTIATGFFTTIRRSPDKKLITVPYNLEYQAELIEASHLLNEAAVATTQPTLKAFLEKRAQAFISNDYYDSDMAWMDLNASIEPAIGPYEVYEDEWFNFKAAFEAFITLTDEKESAKLVRFGAELQELEDHLPIDPAYRRPKLGGSSPIRVVNVVFTSGDANKGVQTAAFNLPNDERVVAAKGSKRVLLKNFQEAKFAKVLKPIAAHALNVKDQPLVSFDPFITHILMHELMHGLGPQQIRVGGKETTVRLQLKELNGPLEEAKADISGLWALQYLMDKGVLDKSQEAATYATFVASSFRTLRFGLAEAHAKGMALQLNWLLDHGGVTVDANGRFGVNLTKIKTAVTSLTTEIMTIQATGDYDRAKALLDRLMVIRPEVKRVMDSLNDVPVDIEPRFLNAE
jgi:Peptidase family M49